MMAQIMHLDPSIRQEYTMGDADGIKVGDDGWVVGHHAEEDVAVTVNATHTTCSLNGSGPPHSGKSKRTLYCMHEAKIMRYVRK